MLHTVLRKAAALIVNIQYTGIKTSNKSPCTFIKRKKISRKKVSIFKYIKNLKHMSLKNPKHKSIVLELV